MLVWEDKLLVDEVGTKVTSTYPPGMDTMTINELLDTTNQSWRVNRISSLFNSRDKTLILSTPLSCFEEQDVLGWRWSTDGNYNVKSAYHLGTSQMAQSEVNH